MINHDAARARAAASAHPDSGGSRRNVTAWPDRARLPDIAPPLPDRRAWVRDANCRGMDPSLFVLDVGASQADAKAAKAVCQGCTVRDECLAYALDINEPRGIWGGLTPKERDGIRSGRPRPPKAIVHGTQSGYVLERRRGLDACAACREAHAEYERIRQAERKHRDQEAS